MRAYEKTPQLITLKQEEKEKMLNNTTKKRLTPPPRYSKYP